MFAWVRAHERPLLEVAAVVAYFATLWVGPTFSHFVGTVAAVTGAVAAWTFVLTYRARPWRTFAEGRHLMAFTLLLAVILSYVSIRALMGSPVLGLEDEAFRLFVYGSIALMLLWRVRLLVDAGRD